MTLKNGPILKFFGYPSLFNPILHGGVKLTPPCRLSYVNRCWMPQMGWFLVTLFVAILEKSWRGHFWNFFENFKIFHENEFFQNFRKIKNFKKKNFLWKSYFLYLNMNCTCSQLSFDVPCTIETQNFWNFEFFYYNMDWNFLV